MTAESEWRALAGLQVHESERTPPGTFVTTEGTVWMHPLDVIAVRTPAAPDRLDAAMAWILAKAIRRLNGVITTREPPPPVSEEAGSRPEN